MTGDVFAGHVSGSDQKGKCVYLLIYRDNKPHLRIYSKPILLNLGILIWVLLV